MTCRDGPPGLGLVESGLLRYFNVVYGVGVEMMERCARQSEALDTQSTS